MISYIQTNSENKDFQELVKQLDASLKITDGDEHSFYDQFNKIDNIKYVMIAYQNNIAIGCGAIKEYDENTMEIKRMFVIPEKRGNGLASQILILLENWSKTLNYKKCILETGKRQIDAIALYQKNNYKITKNYGQYENIENSVCFEKELI
ncbi:MAG: GNAT family N-acetyltransferase [Bacteroidetes bacterium]|nr:MAG: GNAT family N-acetyltransferase [Bacteroidota bacterium]